GKSVPAPALSLNMSDFLLINACTKFRSKQEENVGEADLSLWQEWYVDVYRGGKNNVVRFYLKGPEDAEKLCFIDNNFRVTEF
ncbi:hypothetical protein, partial [Microbulbifer sp. 2205BS26-8]|uniref:hypothetical protein n=1 Tax=Microbulbifer sp. 2205BS26-8 TaxID=3064386 RepID=UPI00273FF026